MARSSLSVVLGPGHLYTTILCFIPFKLGEALTCLTQTFRTHLAFSEHPYRMQPPTIYTCFRGYKVGAADMMIPAVPFVITYFSYPEVSGHIEVESNEDTVNPTLLMRAHSMPRGRLSHIIYAVCFFGGCLKVRHIPLSFLHLII